MTPRYLWTILLASGLSMGAGMGEARRSGNLRFITAQVANELGYAWQVLGLVVSRGRITQVLTWRIVSYWFRIAKYFTRYRRSDCARLLSLQVLYLAVPDKTLINSGG